MNEENTAEAVSSPGQWPKSGDGEPIHAGLQQMVVVARAGFRHEIVDFLSWKSRLHCGALAKAEHHEGISILPQQAHMDIRVFGGHKSSPFGDLSSSHGQFHNASKALIINRLIEQFALYFNILRDIPLDSENTLNMAGSGSG